MILVYRGAGNHSNRLFQAIHFEAFCLENKVDYLNPSFYDMAKFYGLKNRFYHPAICLAIRVFKKIKLIKALDFDSSDKNELNTNTIHKKKLILVEGWNFRVHELTKKYQNYFIKKYSLLQNLYTENEFYKYFSELDRNKYIIVGIHIRRGDYKHWKNGIYYITLMIFIRCF